MYMYKHIQKKRKYNDSVVQAFQQNGTQRGPISARDFGMCLHKSRWLANIKRQNSWLLLEKTAFLCWMFTQVSLIYTLKKIENTVIC